MTLTGGCQCGLIRYRIGGAPKRHSLCQCRDCQRSAGAPIVGWIMADDADVTIDGVPASYNSSGDVQRQFCPRCGTGLFYRSESLFPGAIDIASSTLDDIDAIAPSEIIQTADAPRWFDAIAALPRHARFPRD